MCQLSINNPIEAIYFAGNLLRHRTGGSHEIALRLREVRVLPPFKAKGRLYFRF